jgi:peptidyl-prolyl cis-trans isomerase D
MALMDVGGFFRGGVQNNTVAEVAGLKINGTDFDRKVRRTISQQAMLDTKMAYQLGLIDQYLNSQVSDILLQKAAQEQGIVINEALMAEQIAKLLGPYAKDEASAKDAFRKLLMSQNLTEAEFVSLLRSQVSTNMIRSALQRATATVSTFEANDLYQQKHEQRTGQADPFPQQGHERRRETWR